MSNRESCQMTNNASPPYTIPRHAALRTAYVDMRFVRASATILSVPQCPRSTMPESTASLSSATSSMRRLFVTGLVEYTLLTVPIPSFRTRVHVVGAGTSDPPPYPEAALVPSSMATARCATPIPSMKRLSPHRSPRPSLSSPHRMCSCTRARSCVGLTTIPATTSPGAQLASVVMDVRKV